MSVSAFSVHLNTLRNVCDFLCRDPHKARRKPPSRNKERKEKAPPKEPEIKTEGGESGDVKLENEFGEVAEPPRK